MKLTRISDKKHRKKIMQDGGMVFSRVCQVDDGLVLYLTDGDETSHYCVLELSREESAQIYGTLESRFLHSPKKQRKLFDVSWIDRLLGLS